MVFGIADVQQAVVFFCDGGHLRYPEAVRLRVRLGGLQLSVLVLLQAASIAVFAFDGKEVVFHLRLKADKAFFRISHLFTGFQRIIQQIAK